MVPKVHGTGVIAIEGDDQFGWGLGPCWVGWREVWRETGLEDAGEDELEFVHLALGYPRVVASDVAAEELIVY